jgi:hypothetical protein
LLAEWPGVAFRIVEPAPGGVVEHLGPRWPARAPPHDRRRD